MKAFKKTAVIIVVSASLIYILKNILDTNINLYVVGTLLIICEILFDISLVIILLASGIHKIRLKDILIKDYSKIDFKKPIVRVLWGFNRIIWLVPLVYLLIDGWGQLNYASIILLFIEIAVTIIVGFVVSKNLM